MIIYGVLIVIKLYRLQVSIIMKTGYALSVVGLFLITINGRKGLILRQGIFCQKIRNITSESIRLKKLMSFNLHRHHTFSAGY